MCLKFTIVIKKLNQTLQYVVPTRTARFYVNGVMEIELVDMEPLDFSGDGIYLGDKTQTSLTYIDEVSVLYILSANISLTNLHLDCTSVNMCYHHVLNI